MADNIDVSPGTGKTVRADEVAGALYQVIKPAFGIDGAATLVSATDPLPVTVANAFVDVDGDWLTDTQLRASAVPVSDGGASLSIDDGAGSITVDGSVTTTPAAVTITNVTNTTATSGDNTVVAAPGSGQRLRLHMLQVQLEAATATTVLFKSGSTTFDRVYCAAAGDGKIVVYPVGREQALGTNEAFVINLSGANAVGYTVRYSTEAV